MNCLALRHTFLRRHSAPRNALMDCLRAKAKLAPRDITILARTTPEDRMLDGKRYYRAFPDENPERPSVRAVLDALQKLEAQFRKHITQYRANQPEPKQELDQTKQSRARIANARKRAAHISVLDDAPIGWDWLGLRGPPSPGNLLLAPRPCIKSTSWPISPR
jgi:hypothetical protein